MFRRILMTYDQLLRHIEWAGQTTTYFALKAVVDLHRPVEGVCAACYSEFPCTTITTIEREIV
jgi:hypothetical protein